MATKLGKYLRHLRLDHNEVLLTMAEKLNISPAYLSSIENGKRSIPDNLVYQVGQQYYLSDGEMEELKDAVEQSQMKITVDLASANRRQRDTALTFARRFKNCDDETLLKIKEILQELSEKKGGIE